MLDISSSFISNAPDNNRAEWHFLLALCGDDSIEGMKKKKWKYQKMMAGKAI